MSLLVPLPAFFSLSIAFWAAQGIYARSFYAAGNTVTPATAGWAVTLLSIPIYSTLFRTAGITGLAIASDAGIVIQTLTLAVLLNQRKLVSLSGLELPELARSLATAVLAFAGASAIVRFMPVKHTHSGDLLVIAVASIAWAALAAITLHLTGSKLLQQLRSRVS